MIGLRPARLQHGQGAVELFVALPVLLLLTLSVLQFSLVFTAKNTLDQALFRGVRAATLDHGSLSALRTGAAQALDHARRLAPHDPRVAELSAQLARS